MCLTRCALHQAGCQPAPWHVTAAATWPTVCPGGRGAGLLGGSTAAPRFQGTGGRCTTCAELTLYVTAAHARCHFQGFVNGDHLVRCITCCALSLAVASHLLLSLLLLSLLSAATPAADGAAAPLHPPGPALHCQFWTGRRPWWWQPVLLRCRQKHGKLSWYMRWDTASTSGCLAGEVLHRSCPGLALLGWGGQLPAMHTELQVHISRC
jgi:hypothetical protein